MHTHSHELSVNIKDSFLISLRTTLLININRQTGRHRIVIFGSRFMIVQHPNKKKKINPMDFSLTDDK